MDGPTGRKLFLSVELRYLLRAMGRRVSRIADPFNKWPMGEATLLSQRMILGSACLSQYPAEHQLFTVAVERGISSHGIVWC